MYSRLERRLALLEKRIQEDGTAFYSATAVLKIVRDMIKEEIQAELPQRPKSGIEFEPE